MSFRKYELGSYEDMCAAHGWDVPERYNIATDVCDKHDPDRLAMVWEDWQGNERRVTFGELQELSNRFANVLEGIGIERGDRVATLMPSLPETAAVWCELGREAGFHGARQIFVEPTDFFRLFRYEA